MTFTNVTLALDLSLSQPGFAVLAVTDDGKPIILEKSYVKTTASKPHGYRLGEIDEELNRYLNEYDPDHVVREKGFSRFAATTQALFKVVGVSDLTTYDRTRLKVHEIAPTSVKKIVTGNGKASKDCVMASVMERLQIEQADYFANDDESDAVACGLAYLIEKGLIDG